MSATASCAEEIRAEIAESGGAIRFDRFMARALYGPAGFYTTGTGRAGRRGDFLTSPEVGPLFGAVLARVVDDTWDALGRPARMPVVDVGAGPGTLLRALRAAAPRCADALELTAVELSGPQRASHPDGIRSVADLPAEPIAGVVIANEVLDNVPVRVLVYDGGWRESWVATDGDRFVEVLREPSAAPAVELPPRPPHGARVPVLEEGCRLLTRMLDLLGAGRLLLFDYGVATTAELALRPWRQWLRTYAAHARGVHPLREPGSQDITTDVPLDQLMACIPPGIEPAVRTQRQFLQRWGIDDLVAEGERIWREHAAAPSLSAIAMRSRVREAEALCDPDGLGAFHSLEITRHSA